MTDTLDLTHFRIDVDRVGLATVLIDRKGEAMNTLSPDLTADLSSIIDYLEKSPAVRAVVIASAKDDNFIAGADLRWLGSIEDAAESVALLRQAHEGFARLERLHRELGKPVVAAIHGACLGGGMELALACGMRVVSDDEKRTQLGQPEVQVGLIPGAGGTQRLPRLVGIANGLEMILTGRPVRPRKAKRIGLADMVCPRNELLETARRLALGAVGRPPRKPRLAERVKGLLSIPGIQRVALEQTSPGRRLLFKKAEERMLAETKGNYPAPPAALRAIRAGIEKGVGHGYEVELAEFAKVVVSPEAKALISVFFASQDLKKDTGVDGHADPRDVRSLGIIGGGLMGGGIAAVTATRARVPSVIKEVDDEGVRRGLGYVRKVLDGRVQRRRMTESDADEIMGQVTGSTKWEGFADADLVIEAVFEDLDLKRSILRDVEEITDHSAIFASNTSSLPITDIAAQAARPENVIGMHYFSPVEKMPLLEVIVTEATAPAVTATCVAFGKQQGKTVIVVNDGAGFYTTRIIGPYMNEVGYLVDEGASIEDIDDAMVSWGFPVGPATLIDEVGIDVGVKIAKIMTDAFGDRMRAPENLEKLLADGRKGRKNGRGFYRYEDGKKAGVDESVYRVLGAKARTQLPKDEIQDRLSLAMVNEAVLCLEDGILRSARDGDIGAIFGLGFPPFTGGPFSLIDRTGAASVVHRLDALADQHGDRFEPASMLRDHASSGTRFRP